MNGDVWLGPNAVMAFSRDGYKYSDIHAMDLLEQITFPGPLHICSICVIATEQ